MLQKSRFMSNYILQNIFQAVPSLEKYSRPTMINFSMNVVCNLRCIHCNLWKIKEKYGLENMSTDEIFKILSGLKDWLGHYHLSISGYEPMLRDDLVQIIAYAKKLGISMNLITNGTLIDETNMREFKKAGLELITISLDGIKPETHDLIRGKKGTYERASNGIDIAKKYMKVKIATTVMKTNVDELIDLAKWSQKNDFPIEFQAIQPRYGTDDNWNDLRGSELWPDEGKVCSTIDQLKNISSVVNTKDSFNFMKSYFRSRQLKALCGVGKNSLFITPRGSINICRNVIPVEKFDKPTLDRIWHSERMKKIRMKVNTCRKPCSMLSCNSKKSIVELIKRSIR